MALELRPNCEYCDRDLPPDSRAARICSYECTFCAACVDGPLKNVCPNCGGGFAPRPIRPRRPWREGAGLVSHPPDSRRHSLRYSMEQVHELVQTLRDVPPEDR